MTALTRFSYSRRLGEIAVGIIASGGDRTHLDARVVGGLAPRAPGGGPLAGLGPETRLAARQRVEPRPAVAGPEHARRDVLGHAGDGLEAAAVIHELDPATCGDAAGPGVGRMNPDLGVRLSPGKHRQGATVVVEGGKPRQDAPLAELERVVGGVRLGRRVVGEGREAEGLRALRVELDLARWGRVAALPVRHGGGPA